MEDRLKALEQLGRLRDQKVLSQEEFETEKTRLLARDDKASEPTPRATSFAGTFSNLWQRRVLIPAAVLVAVGLGAYLGLSVAFPAKVNKVPAVTAAAAVPDANARLSAVLKFEKPEECRPGSDLAALFADLRALEPGSKQQSVTAGLNGPSFAPDVVRAQQGNAVIARLPTSGVLEGLRVTELRTTRFDGSDAEFMQIRFAESPERVRSKLNSSGFAIPDLGETKAVELDGGRGLVYGVEKIDNQTALTCAVS